MLNANKNCMQIPTGGTVSVNVILNLTLICHIQPLKMVCISTPRAPLSELDQCSHHKCCVHELQTTRSMLSAGAEDADILFEDELSEERKEKILHDAGITINIPLKQARTCHQIHAWNPVV